MSDPENSDAPPAGTLETAEAAENGGGGQENEADGRIDLRGVAMGVIAIEPIRGTLPLRPAWQRGRALARVRPSPSGSHGDPVRRVGEGSGSTVGNHGKDRSSSGGDGEDRGVAGGR